LYSSASACPLAYGTARFSSAISLLLPTRIWQCGRGGGEGRAGHQAGAGRRCCGLAVQGAELPGAGTGRAAVQAAEGGRTAAA
jgi:hypothetical protein